MKCGLYYGSYSRITRRALTKWTCMAFGGFVIPKCVLMSISSSLNKQINTGIVSMTQYIIFPSPDFRYNVMDFYRNEY